MRSAALVVLFLCGCGEVTFAPPREPSHSTSLGDRLHAARYRTPFLCGDSENAEDRQGFPCTPELGTLTENFSCDSSGCHGVYEFSTEGFGAKRSLRGAEGPSCFSCHGEVWEDVR